MKHLGDITKINGAEIEVVDVVCGGSPCQDLSVAGKRAGLAGERSGLFMEQIRVIKEMREHDRQQQLGSGRTDVSPRPRWMVWENVPGAMSSTSNGIKGADFAAVIEETVKVAEPNCPTVQVPDGGWAKCGCYYDEMGRWSIAWMVHDAQYWGVPQRRKRISLVADFNGLSAADVVFSPEVRRMPERTDAVETVGYSGRENGSEVLSVGESVCRNHEQGAETGEGLAAGTEGSTGESDEVG